MKSADIPDLYYLIQFYRIEFKYSGRESNFLRFVVIGSVPTMEISISYTFFKIILTGSTLTKIENSKH